MIISIHNKDSWLNNSNESFFVIKYYASEKKVLLNNFLNRSYFIWMVSKNKGGLFWCLNLKMFKKSIKVVFFVEIHGASSPI